MCLEVSDTIIKYPWLKCKVNFWKDTWEIEKPNKVLSFEQNDMCQ